MKFKPSDFSKDLSLTDFGAEVAAKKANELLEEDLIKNHRISQWPIILERHRQILYKMRRQSRRIRYLEELCYANGIDLNSNNE